MSDLKLTLRSGLYHVTGTVKIPGRKEGVRVRQSTGTARLRDAETYRDKLRQEVVDREIHGPGHALTFAGCVIIYLEKGGERRFMKPILEKFGATRIKDLTADKVSAFAIERYGHLARAKRQKTRGILAKATQEPCLNLPRTCRKRRQSRDTGLAQRTEI